MAVYLNLEEFNQLSEAGTFEKLTANKFAITSEDLTAQELFDNYIFAYETEVATHLGLTDWKSYFVPENINYENDKDLLKRAAMEYIKWRIASPSLISRYTTTSSDGFTTQHEQDRTKNTDRAPELVYEILEMTSIYLSMGDSEQGTPAFDYIVDSKVIITSETKSNSRLLNVLIEVYEEYFNEINEALISSSAELTISNEEEEMLDPLEGDKQNIANKQYKEKIIEVENGVVILDQKIETLRNDVDLIFSLITLDTSEQVLEVENDSDQEVPEETILDVEYSIIKKDTLGMTSTPPSSVFTVKQELLDTLDISKTTWTFQSPDDDATGILRAWNITKSAFVGNPVAFQIRRKNNPLTLEFSFDEFFEASDFDDGDLFTFKCESTRRDIFIKNFTYSVLSFRENTITEIIERLTTLENRVDDIEAYLAIQSAPLSVAVQNSYIMSNSFEKVKFDGTPSLDVYDKWSGDPNFQYEIPEEMDGSSFLVISRQIIRYTSGTNTGGTLRVVNETTGSTLLEKNYEIVNIVGIDQIFNIDFDKTELQVDGITLSVGDNISIQNDTTGSAVVWEQLPGTSFNMFITKVGIEFSSSADDIYRDDTTTPKEGHIEKDIRTLEFRTQKMSAQGDFNLKPTAPETVDGDIPTTLATKKYVDDKIPGGTGKTFRTHYLPNGFGVYNIIDYFDTFEDWTGLILVFKSKAQNFPYINVPVPKGLISQDELVEEEYAATYYNSEIDRHSSLRIKLQSFNPNGLQQRISEIDTSLDLAFEGIEISGWKEE